jgi:hypothetical protein
LHSLGKEAIPLLIQSLDDKKPFPAIELVNPMWSNLPPEVLGRTFSGVANAYAIELILGKDKLEGDQEDARFLIDSRECVYVYGLLKRNDSVLKSQDLVSLKRRYQVWWNDHKQLPLVELRKQWTDNNRPLTGSDFRWL